MKRKVTSVGGAYLGKVRRHDCPVRELSSGECLQRICCRFHRVELDEDLAYSCGLPAAARRTGDLHTKDWAVFRALFVHVVADFYFISMIPESGMVGEDIPS